RREETERLANRFVVELACFGSVELLTTFRANLNRHILHNDQRRFAVLLMFKALRHGSGHQCAFAARRTTALLGGLPRSRSYGFSHCMVTCENSTRAP